MEGLVRAPYVCVIGTALHTLISDEESPILSQITGLRSLVGSRTAER